MFDKGKGPAVVIVQGLHGRWEWTRKALDALARHCRVLSYSLPGDFGSGYAYQRDRGFENYMKQLADVMSAAQVPRAAVVGISFGGFVATHFAAQHPDRMSALVLASAPGPGWAPNARQSVTGYRPGWRLERWPACPSSMAFPSCWAGDKHASATS